MKRFVILFSLLLLAGSAFATQMMVVGEVFSAPWCGSCPTARSALAQLTENPSAEHLIPLVWNMDPPYESPGGNDRYWWYPGDGYIPWNAFGGTQLDVPSSGMLSAYNTCAAVDSPLEITVSFSLAGDQITATANVEVTGTIPTTTNKLFFVLSAPHENEDANYVNLVIDRSADIPFTLTNVGDTTTETAIFTVNPDWSLAEQNLICIVQSYDADSRFILQAGQMNMAVLIASFSSNLTTGPAQLGVQFTDASMSPATVNSWAWDFDNDGTVDSNEQNPYHLYTEPGMYSVSLTVTDTDGDENVTVMENYIVALDASAVYGTAAGVWVAEMSPYNVISDLTVPENSTLEIEPGVEVIVMNGAMIDVYGQMTAIGLPDEPIFIGSHDNRNPWAGMQIRFSNAPSTFDYCIFERADDTALYVDDAPVMLYNSAFNNNHSSANAAGVHFNSSADSEVIGCRFEGNLSDSNAGAVSLINSEVLVQNCLMVFNEGGFAAAVGAKQSSTLYLVNNTIADNACTGTTHGHVSVFQSAAEVMNNIIRQTDGVSIYNFSGEINATYNNIQGGYEGVGNIDADPYFDEQIEYGLEASSPSIDAANPDTAYNDLEDPDNPGQPLYPAMGTLAGDQGCYGGQDPYEIYQMIPGVDDDEIPSITSCSLSAFPNPFNPTTTIALNIPQDAQHAPVTLAIYNVRGQRVATLLDNEPTTRRDFVWTGMDDNGQAVCSGVYFARLTVAGQTATHKLALLK